MSDAGDDSAAAASSAAATASDEMVSQFLAFTGSADPSRAASYLEMSGGDLETAVGLFMEHQAGGGGGGGGGGGIGGGGGGGGVGGGGPAPAAPPDMADPNAEVRAPDQTRTMRMIDDDVYGGGAGASSASAAALMMAASGRGGGLLGPGGMLGGVPPRGDVVDMMRAFSGSDDMDIDGGGDGGIFDARAVVNAAAAAAARAEEKTGDGGDEDDDDEEEKDDEADDIDGQILAASASRRSAPLGGSTGPPGAPTLQDMFAPPTNLMHRAGGFQGARAVARDARRWLLVNLQRDSEFSCHALNRDVWRDELVENLVREGFIFWQSMDVAPDGQTYAERYDVNAYPHVAIIDPRTGRLMWRKEGWTQVNPMTAEMFAELAADFCSRHSFDKPPVAAPPRQSSAPNSGNGAPGGASRPAKRPMHELTEEQQLQAAIRASMNDAKDDNDDDDDVVEIDGDGDSYDDDDDEIAMDEDDEDEEDVEAGEGGGGGGDARTAEEAPPPPAQPKTEEKKEEEEKPPTFAEELVAMEVGDEPSSGDVARVQIRTPDGKRLVRKFRGEDSVKTIYAFVAQSNEEAKGGREFELRAGFPPKDLMPDIDSTIQSCGLSGGAITFRWK